MNGWMYLVIAGIAEVFYAGFEGQWNENVR